MIDNQALLCLDSCEHTYALRASAGSADTSILVLHTVDSDYTQILMSSSSASFRLLEVPAFLLLQLWLRVKVHRSSIGVILGFVVFYVARYRSSLFRKLPPGPRGYPIIGNVSEMKTGQWLKFAEWHKKYGQLVISSNPLLAHF